MSTKHVVAVIEDDQSIASMYQIKLENSGFEVVVAHDGQKGLELVEKTKPDVLLLDIMMPVMTGDEMLEKLRQHAWAANIRVIVLTNLSKDEAPHALRFLSVDRYVVKAHHTPSQIIEVVREVLSAKPT
jgi:DNA-binding response OmpR family regulator